jgi:hypothetical protein
MVQQKCRDDVGEYCQKKKMKKSIHPSFQYPKYPVAILPIPRDNHEKSENK